MAMGDWLTRAIGALAVASVSGSACGMSQTTTDAARCQVLGADKLPAEIGGAPGICSEIDRAAALASPGADFSVAVRVLSPARLSATIKLSDGRILPEQNFAISDSQLRKSSIERFARRLAEEIAKARA